MFTNHAQRNWIQYALSYSYWIFVLSLPIIQQFYLRENTNRRTTCRSQWPSSLRRASAAPRLLGLWVRILMGAWMSACCECCVLSGRGLCDGPIPCRGKSYWVCVCVCVAILSAIRCNNNHLHLQWVGRGGQTKKREQLLIKMFVCECVGRNWYLVTMTFDRIFCFSQTK